MDKYPKNILWKPSHKEYLNVTPESVMQGIQKSYKDKYFSKPSKFYYLFWLLGLSAFIFGIIAFIYVLNGVPTLSNSNPLNSQTINSNIVASVNKHYFCVGGSNISVTLPDPNDYKIGQFISISVPEPFETILATPTVTVVNDTLNTTVDGQSIFLVSYELGNNKWKQV